MLAIQKEFVKLAAETSPDSPHAIDQKGQCRCRCHCRPHFGSAATATGHTAAQHTGFEEALKIVGIKESDKEILNRLFILFDKTGEGLINFKQFICGCSVLCKGTVKEKLLRACAPAIARRLLAGGCGQLPLLAGWRGPLSLLAG